MPTTTAVTCHTRSLTRGSDGGADGGPVYPEVAMTRATIASASVAEIPLIFGSTPMNVFFACRDPVLNPFREKLFLTGSDYASALSVKGAYLSRYKLACQRYYGKKGEAPDEFLQNLFDKGREMEPRALALWNRLHQDKYIAVASGMLLDVERPDLFGATPDGLVFDKKTKELIGVLELKHRLVATKLSVNKEDIPPKYVMQMIGQLMCLPSWVRRWFYLEVGADIQTFYYHEGEFGIDVRDQIRARLLEFKDLVDSHTIDTFPKRNTSFDWASLL